MCPSILLFCLHKIYQIEELNKVQNFFNLELCKIAFWKLSSLLFHTSVGDIWQNQQKVTYMLPENFGIFWIKNQLRFRELEYQK